MIVRASSNAQTIELKFAVFALLAATSIGCDSVRKTSQSIELVVRQIETQVPVVGVQVQLKIAWMPLSTDRKSGDWSKESWESFPWHTGVTDSTGTAQIKIVETALDSTRGRIPPPNRDWTTKWKYIIKLEGSDGFTEELELLLSPAAVGKTESYGIEVKKVGMPEYVD